MLSTLANAVLGVALMASAGSAPALAPEDLKPLLVGQVVPNIDLFGPSGPRETLYSYVGRRRTVIVFFRGGARPDAEDGLHQLRDVLVPLKEAGYQVVAVSPDPPTDAGAPKGYIMRSDPTGRGAQLFGVGYRARPIDFESEADFARWREARRAQGNAHPSLPVPAVFLVDRKGIVLFSHVNVGFRVELSGEVLLTAARAYEGAK